MVTRSHVPYLAMLVVGVALLVAGGAELTDPEYTVVVETTSESAYESAQNRTGSEFTYEYADLSPSAQESFRAAVESEDGRAAVRAGNRSPEFDYGDTLDRYYVADSGEYYLLTTSGPGRFSGVVDLFAGVVAVLGASAVIAGGAGLWRERRNPADSGKNGD